MKVCSTCKIEKDLNDFPPDKRKRDGRSYRCRKCCNKAVSLWEKANPERNRKNKYHWREKNPEKYKLIQNRHRATGKHKIVESRYCKKHPEKRYKTLRRWKESNAEYVSQYNRNWKKDNPEKCKQHAKRSTSKILSTPRGILNNRMASEIRHSLDGNKKGRHWESLVGYTVEQLKLHLEKQFLSGMSWGNYGLKGWTIDHRTPISVFNFEKPENPDFKKCWSLENLQPMWAKDNIKKSNRIEKPFQPSLHLMVQSC